MLGELHPSGYVPAGAHCGSNKRMAYHESLLMPRLPRWRGSRADGHCRLARSRQSGRRALRLGSGDQVLEVGTVYSDIARGSVDMHIGQWFGRALVCEEQQCLAQCVEVPC